MLLPQLVHLPGLGIQPGKFIAGQGTVAAIGTVGITGDTTVALTNDCNAWNAQSVGCIV